MVFADLIYCGALASAVLSSSVVLFGQFLRGDLTERGRTAAGRAHCALRVRDVPDER